MSLAGGSAFFSNLDDVELSDEEGEEEQEAGAPSKASKASEEAQAAAQAAQAQSQKAAAARAALPSADELFATTDSSRPDFLVTAAELEKEMAFDLRPEPQEAQPWRRKKSAGETGEQAAAVARKQHQNTGIAADITAAATAMSQTYKVASYDDAPAFTAKPLVDMHKRQKAASGVPGGDDDDEDTTPAPKRKGDPHKSFSSKEKRKREMGQASREKSFVEEEKRMLKESTSRKAGYGFD